MKNKIIAVCICLLVLIACIGFMQWRSQDADERIMAQATAQEAQEKTEPVSGNIITKDYTPRFTDGSFAIGNPDAPVTIIEFSSLSCPHCASFHSGALKDIKKDYIDTGKVQFIFNDFPLNAPAVAGSLLLKCIPVDDRYDFMEMLFDQQAQWAFDQDYVTKLKQYASLIGIGNDAAEKCIFDTEVERKMFNVMRLGSQQHDVQSTPTFIIKPSNEKLIGALPYGEFSTRIEKLLKNAE